jgi:hypothetical protein
MADRRGKREGKVISWSGAWMVEKDKQGDRVGDWAEQGEGRTYRCRWCKKVRF